MFAILRLSIVVAVSLLAAGCGTSRGGLEIQIYNRTPDQVRLDIVPEGVAEPLTSPLYQQHVLEKKSMKEIRLPRGTYHLRAEIDDWEGKRKLKLDDVFRENGRIEIERDRMRYVEIPDPLIAGRQN